MQIVSGRAQLTAEEVIDLYDASGWGRRSDYLPESIGKALANTQILIQARLNHRLVGLLRAFSDGVLTTHLSEILVHPAFRGQGVGTALMRALLSQHPITALYVDSFPENQRFFEKFGLRRRDLLRSMSASGYEWKEALSSIGEARKAS